MLGSDFDKVMSDDNVNFSEISIDHEEFLHNYLKNRGHLGQHPYIEQCHHY